MPCIYQQWRSVSTACNEDDETKQTNHWVQSQTTHPLAHKRPTEFWQVLTHTFCLGKSTDYNRLYNAMGQTELWQCWRVTARYIKTTRTWRKSNVWPGKWTPNWHVSASVCASVCACVCVWSMRSTHLRPTESCPCVSQSRGSQSDSTVFACRRWPGGHRSGHGWLALCHTLWSSHWQSGQSSPRSVHTAHSLCTVRPT